MLAGLGGLSLQAAAAGWGLPSTSRAQDKKALEITIAGYPLSHVRALADGRVQPKGCQVTYEKDSIGNMNTHVFSGPATREATEIGLSPYMLAHANEGFRGYSLIPVFPVRLFRHKSIFIRNDRGISTPDDLKGRKVATVGYSSTSLTWLRGIMQHEYGLKPSDVTWFVSEKDSSAAGSGSPSKQENVYPDDIEIKAGPKGKDESDMLADGDVDALFHAAEPRCFVERDPNVSRLFDDYRSVERAYYSKTKIFPIMHAVAMRDNTIAAHPWLPRAVFDAYSEAKRIEYARLREYGWVFETLPWIGKEVEETTELMGDNYWPYGIEANRKALESLFQYSYEQGLAKKRLSIEDLFHASTLDFAEK
jgi:4,5-dihydroxyphthalate decarboxylase